MVNGPWLAANYSRFITHGSLFMAKDGPAIGSGPATALPHLFPTTSRLQAGQYLGLCPCRPVSWALVAWSIKHELIDWLINYVINSVHKDPPRPATASGFVPICSVVEEVVVCSSSTLIFGPLLGTSLFCLLGFRCKLTAQTVHQSVQDQDKMLLEVNGPPLVPQMRPVWNKTLLRLCRFFISGPFLK